MPPASASPASLFGPENIPAPAVASGLVRVLHVTADYGLGGTEAFLACLAQNRDACPNMEAEFLMFKDGHLRQSLTAARATVHCLGEVRLRWPKRVFEARRAFRRLLMNRKFHAVVFHQYPWMPLILGGIARAAQCRTVRWFHNDIDPHYWPEAALGRLRPGFPDLVIYNSAYMQRKIAHQGPNQVLFLPVSPGPGDLSAGERGQIRRQCETDDTAVVVIQVSRMAPIKGHREHVQALALLRDQPDWVCWMVGGAQTPEQEEYLGSLRRLASDLGIAGRVRFLGNRTDARRLLAASDVFCQPNIPPAEAFGISFVEALYAGLPVVTSAIGGSIEIVDEATGITLPTGDVPKLAQALRRLIEDRELRARLGASGPKRAAELCDPALQILHLGAILTRLTNPGESLS